MAKLSKRLAELEKKLPREANALFKSDQYRKLFATRMTRKRAQFYKVARGAADHYTLGVMKAKSVGLSAQAFAKRTPSEGTLVCTLAWAQAADRTPWLEGCAVLGALEIANADGIIRGGGQSHRMADKLVKELGIPMRRQPSNVEHIALEDGHSEFLMAVAGRHATSSRRTIATKS